MNETADQVFAQLQFIRDCRMRVLALRQSMLNRADDDSVATDHDERRVAVELAKIELAEAEIDLLQAS